MSFAKTDLIILAGGAGTRLQPVLDKGQPKAMADISRRPFIDYQLDWLYQAGIRHITLALGYGAKAIQQHIDTLPLPDDLNINSVVEDRPLGTGGGIRFAVSQTHSSPVFVCNGDTIAALDMQDMYQRHCCGGQAVTMALAKAEDCQRFGQIELNTNGSVKTFMEKPDMQGGGLVNVGVYLIQRELIMQLPHHTKLSWEETCLPDYCDGRLYGLINCKDFLDIGTLESLSSFPTFLNSL